MFIQLQYMNEKGENLGGLYLNADHIVAVRNDKYQCRILTVSGVEYLVVNDLSEVLDDLARIQRKREGDQIK